MGDFLEIELERLKRENQELASYVSLTHNIFLSYKSLEDELIVFMMSDSNQRMETYNGTLDKWKNVMLSNDNVEADYIEDFEDLCSDIENCERFILRTVKLRLFDGERLRKCLISGKTVDVDGQKVVYADMVFLNDSQTLKEDVAIVSDKIDQDTGIMNHDAIMEYCNEYIASKPKDNVTLAVIQIDNSAQLIDTFGEDFYKDVLKRTADIIKDAVGNRGKYGRISADQMIIAVDGLYDNESIRSVLRPIKNGVNWMYGSGDDLKISCSIGSATYPSDGPDFDTVYMIADKMLQLAIDKGKDKYLIYIEELHRDYILGGQAVAVTDKRFLKYRRIRSVNDFIRGFYKADEAEKEKLIEMISHALDVDCVLIYDRKKKTKTVVYGNDKTVESIDFLEINNFVSTFREDGLLTIDNISLFEEKAPAFYDVYSKAGIHQAVQYVVGGNIFKDNDLVVTFYRYALVKKWSELEISYIAIVGDIIGNEYK